MTDSPVKSLSALQEDILTLLGNRSMYRSQMCEELNFNRPGNTLDLTGVSRSVDKLIESKMIRLTKETIAENGQPLPYYAATPLGKKTLKQRNDYRVALRHRSRET